MIGLKDSRQLFNQSEAKPIAPCTSDFSHALSKLQIIARNCDWFIALFARCDWSELLLWFWFFDSHLKTALIFVVSIFQTLDNPDSTVCIDFLSITLLNLLQSFHTLSHKSPTVIWQLLFFLIFFLFFFFFWNSRGSLFFQRCYNKK